MPNTMIFIHGAWLASNSWDDFARYFGARGYVVSAPEWPRKAPDVEEQRAEAEALAGLGVEEIVDHYAAIVEALDEPPVLVGHSFGGLFVQMLLDRGLGAAGVALDPAPFKGILRLEPSELKAAGPALNHPLHRHGVVPLSFEEFNYAFTNTWDEDAAREAYERLAVPETARILFQGGFANFALHPATKVDHGKGDRAPLLITAGEHDNTVPKGVARSAYEKYDGNGAVTDFVEFPGRSHLLVTGPGWEEVSPATSRAGSSAWAPPPDAAGMDRTGRGLGLRCGPRDRLAMHEIRVNVASPEEASHGVAEFWAGGELFAFTRLEDDDLLLHVVPRPDGTTVVVAAHHLAEALARARALLS